MSLNARKLLSQRGMVLVISLVLMLSVICVHSLNRATCGKVICGHGGHVARPQYETQHKKINERTLAIGGARNSLHNIRRNAIAHSVDAMKSYPERTAELRRMLGSNELTLMPCCYDGLSARLVEAAGFNLTFMTGFGVSASYGLPDTGLVSAGEMVDAANTICASLRRIPCIGDGDTGYGSVANVKRTVLKYAQAGLSGIMIEDQLAPKRCGHTKGKQVVDRAEAARRVQAAVDARDELIQQGGGDVVILARTDARITSLEEAIARCQMFMELGADWTFLEAPRSTDEMRQYCAAVPGPKLANMLEFGDTPILSPEALQELGYSVAAYPLTLLSASAKAMKSALQQLRAGNPPDRSVDVMSFEDLKTAVGFPEFYQEMERYAD